MLNFKYNKQNNIIINITKPPKNNKNSKNNKNNIIIIVNKNKILKNPNQLSNRIPNEIKVNYNIPPNIFQTWHSKLLPVSMLKSVINIRKLNPEFRYYLFDDNDCRNFIQKNFDSDVLFAFDNLIPGAYKADLWRYCVLFKLGGIYLDIKFIPYNNFKFINLLDKEHLVLDRDKAGIYNAFMVCKPNNNILLSAINQIVENVKNKYYGKSPLEPTGPKLLIKYFTKEEISNLDMNHITNGNNCDNKFINYNGEIIIQGYKNYFQDRNNHSITSHYYDLWKEHNIYK
jgi:mannosyltransferase OCH1-like enzyme